jgi:pimeloyl-ACP methyl ester carboxylesterase
MPIARRDDLRLHYELTPAGAREAGTPVLLVMGLGVSATGWWPTVPILAESRPVIAFDNRGVGRSDRVPDPYSTPEMADDAIAVLDGAGFERAHVYGISLGGMIAQEIVLRHPDRVAGLVLGATAAGGPDAISPDETTLAFFRRRAEMPASEAVWASVPYSYGSTMRPRARAAHRRRPRAAPPVPGRARALRRSTDRALAGGLPHLPNRRARGRPLGGAFPRRGRRRGPS